jgi:hypothetical protein
MLPVDGVIKVFGVRPAPVYIASCLLEAKAAESAATSSAPLPIPRP